GYAQGGFFYGHQTALRSQLHQVPRTRTRQRKFSSRHTRNGADRRRLRRSARSGKQRKESDDRIGFRPRPGQCNAEKGFETDDRASKPFEGLDRSGRKMGYGNFVRAPTRS